MYEEVVSLMSMKRDEGNLKEFEFRPLVSNDPHLS